MMRQRILSFVLGLCVFGAPAFAARFQAVKSLSDGALESLSDIAGELQKDEQTFGKCSSTNTFSFTRKADEKDLNTAKQLNIAKGGILAQDEEAAADAQSLSAEKLAEHLLSVVSEGQSDPKALQRLNQAKERLAKQLLKVKAKSDFKFFTATHSYENGTWSLVDVLDLKHNEVLVLQFGVCGT